MGLFSLLSQDPLLFIFVLAALLSSIIAHEVAHGWVAHLFGDDTAKLDGRLTFNPIPHIDPIGAVMLIIAGFGWAKPVPVNYYTLRNTRFGLFAVSLAGCVTNILIAIVALVILRFKIVSEISVLAIGLQYIAHINILLGAFNLIPLPPLDGSKILMEFLPENAQESLAQIEPYGFFILIFLLFTHVLDPVIAFMQNLVYGLISLLFGLFG